MLTGQKVLSKFSDPVDTITLDETGRHRRRVKLVSDKGIEFLLNLAAPQLLQHGEGIELDDGRVIQVVAQAEPLLEVWANSSHHLIQLAWQLGNRHLQTQVFEDHLVIRQDHVIKNMLEGLGARVVEVVASFNPETGAYSGKHQNHGPGHGHSHD